MGSKMQTQTNATNAANATNVVNVVNQRTIETLSEEIFVKVNANNGGKLSRDLNRSIAASLGYVVLARGRSGFSAPTLAGLTTIGKGDIAASVAAFLLTDSPAVLAATKKAEKQAARAEKLSAKIAKATEKLEALQKKAGIVVPKPAPTPESTPESAPESAK